MGNAKHVWNAEGIRKARKTRNLTQAQLAEGLGCRQQTISEWELGMYEPKNAYQKLLSLFFGSTPVVDEEVPASNVWNESEQTRPETSVTGMVSTDAAPTAAVETPAIDPNTNPERQI